MHDVKLLRDFGQPNLDLTIDRRRRHVLEST
jgi:hypothetical protein